MTATLACPMVRQALILGAASVCASAQSQISLRSASDRFAHEFTDISGIRELSNGTFIVVDRGAHAVFVVGGPSSPPRTIGRQGEGPGEYRYPALVFPLGADSSVVVDAQLRRWIVLSGDRIVRTLGPESELIRHSGVEIVGRDSQGRVASIVGEQPFTPAVAGMGQERFLILRDARNATVDTATRLSVRRATTIVRRGATTYFLENPLNAPEQGVLMGDGWLAIARVNPYRVEWRSPSGELTASATVAEVLPRVSDLDKRNAVARDWFVPRYSGPVWKPEDFSGWPTVMPPFLRDALLGTPEGRLLVRRTPRAGASQALYDVFEKGGGRVAQLALPPDGRIIGFGKHQAYLVQRTADDAQVLSRHPWP